MGTTDKKGKRMQADMVVNKVINEVIDEVMCPCDSIKVGRMEEKTIDDIEKMSIDELEALSKDSSIPVPEGLSEKIENIILASSLVSENVLSNEKSHGAGVAQNQHNRTKVRKFNWKKLIWIPVAAASVAAVAISVRDYSLSQPPKDSFSTPEEAYAQVEQTFAMISDKTGKAVYLTDAAFPEMNKTSKILETMTR